MKKKNKLIILSTILIILGIFEYGLFGLFGYDIIQSLTGSNSGFIARAFDILFSSALGYLVYTVWWN